MRISQEILLATGKEVSAGAVYDRDPLYPRGFHEVLSYAGVAPVRLPPKSSNLNAYAERFVLSIKSECLDGMVMLGERHLLGWAGHGSENGP